MTIIAGVLCQDGAVLGADTAMTDSDAGGRPVSRDLTEKIRVYPQGSAIFTHTGEQGCGQRLGEILREVAKDPASSGLVASKLRDNVQGVLPRAFVAGVQGAADAYKSQGRVPTFPEFNHVLAAAAEGQGGIVAMPCAKGVAVIAFEGLKHCWLLDEKSPMYVMGSGQSVGSPFLAFVKRVLWGGKLPFVDDAVLGLYWVLNHAIDHVAFGVGGTAHIAVLRKEKGTWVAKRLTDDDLEGPRRLLGEIEGAIASVGRGKVAAADKVPGDPAVAPKQAGGG